MTDVGTAKFDLIAVQRDLGTSPQYWVAYVMGAFQGPKGLDHDPIIENPGAAGRTVINGSLIYQEFILDRSRTGDGPGQPWDAVLDEQQVVVHEMIHQFKGLLFDSNHDTVGIFKGGLTADTTDNFIGETTKAKIRSALWVNNDTQPEP